MNIIRFNWFTLIKLSILAIVYLCLTLIVKSFFRINRSSLEYDTFKREFKLNLNNDQLNYFILDNKNALKKRIYNDFYQIDQNDKDLSKENLNLVTVKIQIKSARFDYFKIGLENWVEYLENVVKSGLNTIEIEIVWNLHEPNPKEFEFKKKNLDLEEFIKIVKLYRLFLIVRIDPYLPCSDYDLGGLPNWLLADTDLESREKNVQTGGILKLNDPTFRDAFENYLNNLLPILSKYQLITDGPIIGILIQLYESNQNFNSYQNFYDEKYKNFIKKKLYTFGIIEMVLKSINVCEYDSLLDSKHFDYYCDSSFNIYLPDFYKKINTTKFHYCVQADMSKSKPDLFKFKSNLNELITTDKSLNINNFFCLNNYEFSFLPKQNKDICLVNEAGQLTNRFFIAQEVFTSNTSVYDQKKIKNINKSDSIVDLIEISVNFILSYEKFVNNLHAPILLKKLKKELFMEYLNINYSLKTSGYGYILYKLNINLNPGSLILVKINYINDYATLICDYKHHLLTIDHSKKLDENYAINLNSHCTDFLILVENRGRSSLIRNDTKFSSLRKGIVIKEAIMFKRENKDVFEIGDNKWRVNFLDFSPKFFNRITFNSEYMSYEDFKNTELIKLDAPLFAYAKFDLKKYHHDLKGIYLMLKDWNKGAVFVNGFNLGRYYNENENNQKFIKIFLPKNYLSYGLNEIILFDLHGISENSKIYFSKENYF